MISDAPYATRSPILPVWVGALAGVAAAVIMLGVTSALGGRGWSAPLWVWLCVHLAVGAVGGALHAASQLRVPGSAVLVTGLFYGVMVWAVSRFIVVGFVGAPLSGLLRSTAWFGACLAYGLVLGGLAAVWQMRHPPADDGQSVKD
jgi:hypothetical protein